MKVPPPLAVVVAQAEQSGAVALRIWAQVITRVSRAVCTLSMASRAFSRAISCAEDVPTIAMPK